MSSNTDGIESTSFADSESFTLILQQCYFTRLKLHVEQRQQLLPVHHRPVAV